jgi:hypothetical protein
MLTYKDLRIGNYVHYHGGDDGSFCRKGQPRFLAPVTDLGRWGISWECLEETPKYYHNSIEGIRLTSEWLERFGFEKGDVDIFADPETGDNDFEYGYKIKENNNLLFWIYKRKQAGYETGKASIEIKFVHQLQNLFFALTGSELTIKENIEK